ncbi:hypothetical protein ACGFZB_25885 [Streptomyces cinerochromogenes]|uniref:Uncharacterized protein n=1 Tax=Streptomyces cinerochromogenes TaxID=66422 RepID=A0ABW7B9E0_9ACTN
MLNRLGKLGSSLLEHFLPSADADALRCITRCNAEGRWQDWCCDDSGRNCRWYGEPSESPC